VGVVPDAGDASVLENNVGLYRVVAGKLQMIRAIWCAPPRGVQAELPAKKRTT
jgi:hypothetical protein